MGISRVLRNDMTLIYLNNTIQNVILNIVLIKKITGINADYPYKNNIGLTIQDYGSVIREVCAIYSVPVIDVNALSGISTLNITTYLQDQVHPNSAGGMKIANVVIDALIQYVLMDLTNPYIEDTKM